MFFTFDLPVERDGRITHHMSRTFFRLLIGAFVSGVLVSALISAQDADFKLQVDVPFVSDLPVVRVE